MKVLPDRFIFTHAIMKELMFRCTQQLQAYKSPSKVSKCSIGFC